MTNTKWNYTEFSCFLLIYVSHVDIDFADEEKSRIKERYGEDLFQKMFNIFDEMSDFQALQTIIDYKGLYFPTLERKKELLDNIMKQFYADGEYSIMEKELYHFLEKLL